MINDNRDEIARETCERLRGKGLRGAWEIGTMRLELMATEDGLRVLLRGRAKITVTRAGPGAPAASRNGAGRYTRLMRTA